MILNNIYVMVARPLFFFLTYIEKCVYEDNVDFFHNWNASFFCSVTVIAFEKCEINEENSNDI